jgi:hypothetical protein
MAWFIQAGGAPGLVVLVFGLVLVLSAAAFAIRPERSKLAHLAALVLAVAASGIAGLAMDLIAVGRFLSTGEVPDADLARTVLLGVAESLSPVVSAFSLVAVAGLLVALGLRRASNAGA